MADFLASLQSLHAHQFNSYGMSYRITYAIIFLMVFGGLTLSAQSKKAQKLYEKARQELSAENTAEALSLLDKAIEDSPSYMDALLLKAEIFRKQDRVEESIPLYKQALESGAPYYVTLFYGQTLFMAGRYEEALEPLKAYVNHPQARPKYIEEADKLIKSAEFAVEAVNNPVDYEPTNLGPLVNTRDMEYFPSISADGNTLVYTYRKMEGESSDEDFWVTRRDPETGEWQKSRPLRGFLNTQLNEGAQSITSDGQALYFAACDRPGGEGSCDIYVSYHQGGGNWSRPVNLGGGINTAMWESQPSVSADGNTLYFVRGKHSFDKNIDIYFSRKDKYGRWQPARKLPGKVNTGGQESSPYIHFDNQSLYFSSNGHPGMGDMDFFVSRRQEDGTWGEPENLGYPINSAGQEFSLVVAPDGKTGFFSSDNIESGYGLLDLYSFVLPEESQAEAIAYVKGRVINQQTKAPISSAMVFTDLNTGKVVEEELSSSSGYFFTVLPANSDYSLNIEKKGFLFYSKNFSLSKETAEKAYQLEVQLIPISAGQKVELENVFFDFDSFELDHKSDIELKSVVQFMVDNPSVKISIEGHTDTEGDSAYNLKLSRERARSVYQFLVDQSIDPSRLEYEGLGDTQPVASNDTEEGRAKNRRTELRITAY